MTDPLDDYENSLPPGGEKDEFSVYEKARQAQPNWFMMGMSLTGLTLAAAQVSKIAKRLKEGT